MKKQNKTIVQNKTIIIICFVVACLITAYYIIDKSKQQTRMPIFSKELLSQALKEEMIKTRIWSSECPISLDRLNLLKISYIDFAGNIKNDGTMVVHDVVADYVLEIFKTLYNHKFPVAKIKLLNEYNGDDKLSMEDNNTSAFNCRRIENSEKFSIHSYGLAIDLNPEQNPFLITNYEDGKTSIPVSPAKGMEYINRLNLRPGMVENKITDNETVVDLFKNYGFSIWGGKWNDPVDWHHFQLTREQAEKLSQLEYNGGIEFFKSLTQVSLSK